MIIEEKIRRSIKRSEKAYELYLEEKLYFQALRIYKANKLIYGFLQEFIYECEDGYLDQVILYLFHLEDWFESFEFLQESKPALDATFVFERIKGAQPFPQDFLKNVLNQ